DARGIITAIRERGKLPVVVGGTGFYIRALLRGLDPAPPADPSFRRELDLLAAREGRRALHERLSREAPALARRLHPNDYVRVMRALELTPAEATRLMQRDTVRYAKRQWTWFAREPDVQWLDVVLAGGPEGVATLITERLTERGLIG